MPAVAGLHNASAVIPPGAIVAVDGATGEVIVDPDEQALQQVAARRRRARRPTSSRSTSSGALPAVTADGVAIRLEANIEIAGRRRQRRGSAAPKASACSAPSSCSPAADRRRSTEEAQYVAYRRLLEACAPGGG